MKHRTAKATCKISIKSERTVVSAGFTKKMCRNPGRVETCALGLWHHAIREGNGCEMHPDGYPKDSSRSGATLMLQECSWRLLNALVTMAVQGC